MYLFYNYYNTNIFVVKHYFEGLQSELPRCTKKRGGFPARD